MPVSSTGSPSGPRVVTSSTGSSEVASSEQPAAQQQGWVNSGNANAPARPLDLTVRPQLTADDIAATIQNPVRRQLEIAAREYQTRIEDALGHDAVSIARGRRPMQEGDTLTPEQTATLQAASVAFLKSVPLGALAPTVAAKIESKLEAAGLTTRPASGTKLGDLGHIGGDIVKDLVGDLHQSSPAAYYALLGGLLGAIGSEADKTGSARLSKWGIRAEMREKFFDDQLEVKLRANWEAHFKNFSTTATITGRYESDSLKLSATAVINSRTGAESANVVAIYRPNDNLALTATYSRDMNAGKTQATAEALWRVQQNVDLALSATRDTDGERRVGVGVRIRY